MAQGVVLTGGTCNGAISSKSLLARQSPGRSRHAPSSRQCHVIGFLSDASPDGYTQMSAAFRQGLKDIGFVEGQNVAIEYRFAMDNTIASPR